MRVLFEFTCLCSYILLVLRVFAWACALALASKPEGAVRRHSVDALREVAFLREQVWLILELGEAVAQRIDRLLQLKDRRVS